MDLEIILISHQKQLSYYLFFQLIFHYQYRRLSQKQKILIQ